MSHMLTYAYIHATRSPTKSFITISISKDVMYILVGRGNRRLKKTNNQLMSPHITPQLREILLAAMSKIKNYKGKFESVLFQ